MNESLQFKIDEPYKFEEVKAVEFYTYLEDIKQMIKKDMPQWHINKIGLANPAATYYHLCQWDFSVPRTHRWPLRVEKHVFAFEREDAYLLLNRSPILGKNI